MFYFIFQEAWDYIGSSRMVYDMDKDEFPPDPWKVQVTFYYSTECMCYG